MREGPIIIELSSLVTKIGSSDYTEPPLYVMILPDSAKLLTLVETVLVRRRQRIDRSKWRRATQNCPMAHQERPSR
jgi:hypothetical protein